MMRMYWPIILAVFADVIYQVCAKSTPREVNPFASLTITYLVGALVSGIIGLEAGSIYMYKAGWNMNTGYIVKSLILGIALIAAGYVLYKESLSATKAIGVCVCLVGLFLINK